MFDEIEKQSHAKLQEQIDKLKEECERNADVAEMVRLLLQSCHERDKYNKASLDAKTGGCISTIIWEISGISILGEGELDASWAAELRHFIGNYIYDDIAFDFSTEDNGRFDFRSSQDGDRFLQDPRIIIEAARANAEYYHDMGHGIDGMLAAHRAGHKVDPSKVYALLDERDRAVAP